MSRLFSSGSVLGASGATSTATRMASNIRKVTHCIFDMDGLLLDTEKLYTEVTQSIADPYGKTFTWEIKQSVMGLQRDPAAAAIVKALDLPMTPEEYVQVSTEKINQLMSNAQLMPDTEKIYERILGDVCKSYNSPYPWATRMRVLGTTEQRTVSIIVNDLKLSCTVDDFLKKFREKQLLELGGAPLLKADQPRSQARAPRAERLVRHLHQHNIPIALATSSGADSVEVKIKNHQELFALFNHKVMGSSDAEVKEGKPAPDIFLVAAKRFPDSPKPDQCLVFEDAPNGVTAGVSAGMQVVMVPDPHISEEQRKHATVVLDSLEEFKPEQFGLPAFE
ncbi:conserved hypothetical protein [Culex quinquefasciatus]|uniref:pseudouridine 5'-phosphatase n=1 Tax=Culex quinquefasciatus TaxID=7176 RepID=B0WUX6_CULQU|nr:conserved hypothetical protein [Culex quinquefasciatus]|eukprot:XP_001859908.1 conserved hypothetical protein [Culex quinquefasciatus]